MASYAYITDTTATQVYTCKGSNVLKHARIQVNATAAVSVKVIDGTSGTTANVATIGTLVAGAKYDYWNLTSGFLVIASGACDITAMADASGRIG
jgi:hypothetical protein